MRKDRDPRRSQWCEAFVESASRVIRSQTRGRDGEEWSVFLAVILQEVLTPVTAAEPTGHFGGRFVSLMAMGRDLGLPRKTVRRYLVALARAGVVKAMNTWDRESKQNFPVELVVRPDFAAVYANLSLRDARGLGEAAGSVWLSRADLDGEWQGFLGVAKWGTWREKSETTGEWIDPPSVREPPTLATEGPKAAAAIKNPSDIVAKILEKSRPHPEAAAKQEKAKRSALEDRFVQVAADIWMTTQARKGFGNEPPTWAAPKGALGPEQSKNRRALVKAFRIWGGFRALTAWASFVDASRMLDENGKPVFNPDLGWAQWTGSDRKPTDFEKHLDAIMAVVLSHSWSSGPKWTTRLKEIAGIELYEAAPTTPAKATLTRPIGELRNHGATPKTVTPSTSAPSRGSSGVDQPQGVPGQGGVGAVW